MDCGKRESKRPFIRWSIAIWCIYLSLVRAEPVASQAEQELRKTFLQSFARAYFPGRSGQIMVVPRKGEMITRPEPVYQFMHGSPWDYDVQIPLLLYGPPYVRTGVYNDAANHQDIAPTLAALLRLRLPPTVTGRALLRPLNLSPGRPRVIFLAVLDGMRRDYFDRYASDLPTLTRLRKQGAWFSRAQVNYLPSTTALAHATIGSGADPQVHGIVLNAPFNRVAGRQEDPFPEMSPQNLMALTLADAWNLANDGHAVIIAQGSVFYAAAGLGGHGACILNGRPIILASYDTRSGDWQTNPLCYRLPEYLKDQNSRTVWEAANGTWLGHTISNPANRADRRTESGLEIPWPNHVPLAASHTVREFWSFKYSGSL